MFKWLFKKKGCAKHMNNKLEVIGIDHGWSMMKTMILSILVYTFFSRMFDLMLPPVAKHSIVVA